MSAFSIWRAHSASIGVEARFNSWVSQPFHTSEDVGAGVAPNVFFAFVANITHPFWLRLVDKPRFCQPSGPISVNFPATARQLSPKSNQAFLHSVNLSQPKILILLGAILVRLTKVDKTDPTERFTKTATKQVQNRTQTERQNSTKMTR